MQEAGRGLLHSSPMDRSELYRRIAAGPNGGDVVIPTHAELGLRIRRTLDDPNCSVDQAAKLVQADPFLAARVVAVANSVAYNPGGREIADVRQAVARLGFRTLRTLAMSLLVKQLSGEPANPVHRELAQGLWEHTVHVAALCHVIARRVTHQDPEAALFAGILHEVAGFYLIARAKEMPELLEGDLADWQGEGEKTVGAALLKALEVPEAVVQAIDDLWEGYLAIPSTSLGDTLLLAEELAPVASPLYWSPGAESADTGLPRIDMVLDSSMLSEVLAESAGEVQSLISALK